MYLDTNLLFSNDQSLAMSAGNDFATYSVDLWKGLTTMPGIPGYTEAAATRPLGDLFAGGLCRLFAQITTAADSTEEDATMQIAVVSATDAALSGSGSLTVLASTAAIAEATLVAGYRFLMPAIPFPVVQRYLGLRYVIGTHALTSGNITAGLVLDVPTGVGY